MKEGAAFRPPSNLGSRNFTAPKGESKINPNKIKDLSGAGVSFSKGGPIKVVKQGSFMLEKVPTEESKVKVIKASTIKKGI